MLDSLDEIVAAHTAESYSRPSSLDDFTSRPATSNDLFKAAANNFILAHFIDGWRAGHWSLEKALTMACVHLAQQNSDLMSKAVMTELMKPPAPLFMDDKTFEPVA